MIENKIDMQIAIQNLNNQISRADDQFDEWVLSEGEWYDPVWSIESCFFQLLIIAELMSLLEFRRMVYEEYITIKDLKNGFYEKLIDPNGDPHSAVIGTLRCYINSLENIFPINEETTVTKDILQIIRDMHYVITDKGVFQNLPENENDVHIRIEAILKCVFPDLKHKPVLTKQIKNFIPDTGIPSVRTLIEYKYLSKKSDVGVIADQILADTRGYTDRDWKRYIYVVYETNRFRTERDWNSLLREAQVGKNTSIVVLSGEPVAKNKI